MQLPCPFRATILISNNSRLTWYALSLTQLMQHVGTSPSDGSHRIGRVFNVANRSFLGAWHVFSPSYLFLGMTSPLTFSPTLMAAAILFGRAKTTGWAFLTLLLGCLIQYQHIQCFSNWATSCFARQHTALVGGLRLLCRRIFD
jgi:hypothetical protein